MSKSRSSRPSRRTSAAGRVYFESSKQPLQILAFLLPFIIIYEVSLVALLRSDRGIVANKAHVTLLRFFEAFGIPLEGSLYLGGIAVIVVLLIWHALTRDPWKIDLQTIGFMVVESLMLTFPLLVLGQLLRRVTPAAMMLAQVPNSASPDGTVSLHGMGLGSEWALSVGAGLYEELMFRMLLIAVLHTLLVDVGKASSRLGAAIAVTVSAAAFAAYHHERLNSGANIAFYFLAGLYFGGVYVIRGFGIAVGVHALYDVITFTLLAPDTPAGG